MTDLFQNTVRKEDSYSAQDIEVLEGLEPVRRRPGMYIGGVDERALHHLVAEILDNAMDEAVAGHASRIDLELAADATVTVRDNGRGIPVDEHPKYPGKSALEVIMTTLHSGGKFSGKAYATSGGLHGVGMSVVNALSDRLTVEIARDRQLYTQSYSRGLAVGGLVGLGPVHNRRGTTVKFHPDALIFGEGAAFKPERLYRMARSKAYLYKGVEIRWACDPELLGTDSITPASETLHFPGGLNDYLTAALKDRKSITPAPFAGEAPFPGDAGRAEWAIAWPEDEEGFIHSYCNTVPTPQGGSHEMGLRTALTRGIKAFGELVGNKRAAQITADDVFGGATILLSVFIRDPSFQGQTKEKLATARGGQAGRYRGEGPFRPLALRQSDLRQRPARLPDREGGGAAAQAPGQGDVAQDRDSQAPPARQAGRLQPHHARGHGNFPGRGRQRRRLRQAGPQPRNPGDPAAARQDPERGERQRRQDARRTRS